MSKALSSKVQAFRRSLDPEISSPSSFSLEKTLDALDQIYQHCKSEGIDFQSVICERNGYNLYLIHHVLSCFDECFCDSPFEKKQIPFCISILDSLLQKGVRIAAKQPENDWQAIHYAARIGDADLMSFVLKQQPDLEALTCAHHSAVMISIEHHQDHMLDLLLNHHAKVNVVYDQLRSPLQLASTEEREPMIRRLLQAGAEIDLTNKKGDTALHLLAGNPYRDFTPTIKLLVGLGASTELKGSKGKTPLELANEGYVSGAIAYLSEVSAAHSEARILQEVTAHLVGSDPSDGPVEGSGSLDQETPLGDTPSKPTKPALRI